MQEWNRCHSNSDLGFDWPELLTHLLFIISLTYLVNIHNKMLRLSSYCFSTHSKKHACAHTISIFACLKHDSSHWHNYLMFTFRLVCSKNISHT